MDMFSIEILYKFYTMWYNLFTYLQISISECSNLQVILKDDILSKQGSRQGVYEFNEIVNGRNSWKTSSQAIWYIPEFKDWAIGPLSGIGTKLRGITSVADLDTKVFNVPNNKWYYWDSEWKVIKSGDITINCFKGKNRHNNCSDPEMGGYYLLLSFLPYWYET